MDQLNSNIAANLRKIRLARGYSLDVVAEQTGVSKSMLGQIERGEANPTVGTIGKIVSGLRVELRDLLDNPMQEVYPIQKKLLIPSKEAPGAYKVYTYFPYEKERNFEIYVIEIQPGAKYYSGSHGEQTREYIVVEEGVLRLIVGECCYTVMTGDAIRFDTDKEHEYRNDSDILLRFTCVFSYQ